jgi:flagellin-specific chaperone FliS
MKAESEVAIFFALSIFSNEKFKADDDRLNYQSYKELGLICGQCRELIFFKKGRERVSHFSHFKTTGKDCQWRTGSDSNTLHTDAEGREQSLEKFQTKFKSIIEEGIIKHQQISSSQLREQIKEGQRLVSTYKIDIDSWLRWFNQNRKPLRNLAKSLYQTNELVSEENQIILLNFVDYLCVPASEYILRDILYYVFGLLDKEISLKKYLEELPSKVIELMSYADWEKEYQVAQESLTFNEFPGYTHPNLPAKPPKSATITERIEPKPIQLDGARTNDHEYQLKAIIGHVPAILSFKKSFHQWQLIALPIKVPQYHLAVYLSDKVGSTELTSHIKKQIENLSYNLARNQEKMEEVKKQITNLPDSEYFLPRSRSLQTEIDSLAKVSDDIKEIISSLEGLTLNIKQNRKPDKLDILESTKIVEKMLKDEHIKPESSYTDNYYRYHVLGNLEIIEQVEREKPTYSLTILGDEKDTRRSSIPLVMNWLRRVPQILQKHFGEDYPTNEEIKAHLMSIYPFYKRRLREGDKLDKSYVNVEADMIIKTKGRLIIELYFNGILQTSQLLSITKPVDGKDRQGKIPVKISSTINLTSRDSLTNLLRCEYKETFKAQNHINLLVQKFVDSNIQLFTKTREEKIVSRVAIKDLLGFSKDSKGLPQVAKQFNRFALPLTSDSEVDLGKFVNLLTLETYDRHDTQNLFEAMVNNWKHWNKGGHISLGGFMLLCRNPGDLMTKIYHTAKHNQDRSQVVWGEFIDQLYLLTKIPIGFRTSEGVLLTPWSLLDTDKKTWNYRVKIQLIDILYTGQAEKIKEAEELMKDEKTREEGKKLRDKARIGAVESWLQYDIDMLYNKLFQVRPNWESLVHQNVLSHLSALSDALNVASTVH